MLGAGARNSFLSPLSLTHSSALSSAALSPLLRCCFKPYPPQYFTSVRMSTTTTSATSAVASSQIVEHIVLFKVKPDADPSKVSAMVNGLNSLVSLPGVAHLSMGSLLRSRSSTLSFTHILHSRYKSKPDLSAYSLHPDHVAVVKDNVRPIIDDIMAVDWVVDDLAGPVVPTAGSAMRVTFLKLKENLGENEKSEVLGVLGGIKNKLDSINQLSVGENFSPDRAKGFSIASIAVFPGVAELEALDSKSDLVNAEKEKVRDLLDGVVVVDYALPVSQSASL